MPLPEETLRSGSETYRPDPSLHLLVPADLMAPARARRAVSAWLGAHRWPDEPSDDLVLVISEAVSNSVEHGYGVAVGAVGTPTVAAGPGAVVEVTAEVVSDAEQRHIVVTVRDEGAWRPPPTARSNRRHGLPLIRACSAEVSIDGTPHGTTLVLRSHPVRA